VIELNSFALHEGCMTNEGLSEPLRCIHTGWLFVIVGWAAGRGAFIQMTTPEFLFSHWYEKPGSAKENDR
jgi:hypothetical protein